jgi:murein DD-endopeptidase MepM/ murein hydrolase activator NlpD
MTKKVFGTFITPESSPVQPERFRGYHAGIDLEMLPGESAHDVAVVAACDGAVIRRQRVGGYGGVVVQQCSVDGEVVTVLYGHLSLASVRVGIGEELQSGDAIGTLGEGYGVETDGERPHLHFAVHRGSKVDWRGYAQREDELQGWMDPGEVVGR